MKHKYTSLLLGIFCLASAMLLPHPSLSKVIIKPPALDIQKDTFRLGVAIKCNINLNLRGSTGLSCSVSGGIRKEFKIGNDFYTIPAYQLSCNIYYNGLGNNILDEFKEMQLDLVNSVTLTNGFGLDRNERPAKLRSFNDMTANPIENDLRWSFSLGTNYIFNNHARNQQLGSFSFNLWKVLTFGYYNDAAPFHKLGLGDRFDRLWTGGGFGTLNIGRLVSELGGGDSEWTDFRLYYNYERFTADVQAAYVMSKYLSLDHVLVKNPQDNFYNRGQTTFGIKHANGWGFNVDFLGQFPAFDLQDKTHIKRGFSRHFSNAAKRYLFDFNYQSLFINRKVELQE